MNIYLTGYRGAGKSVVGRLVAAQLDYPFIDLDVLIAEEAGMPIAGIFADEGESGFRRRESSMLEKVALDGPAVIAPGGGICLSELNREVMRQTGKIVFLQADAETLLARLEADPKSDQQRPPLTSLPAADELRSKLQERRAGYEECADLILNTVGSEPEQVAMAVCQWHANNR